MENAPLISTNNNTEDFNSFSNACNHFAIEINNNQLMLFKKYHEVLLEWNKKINLISRKGETSIIEKHFLDSIIFLPEIEKLDMINHASTKILDIGSGGGFPAIPLAIMKPDWDFTLCESTKKKSDFLSVLIKELGLTTKVHIINGRAEELKGKGRVQPPNKFDFITVRAVAKLDELINYSFPLLKQGGYLLAYKAKDISDEIKNAEKFIEKRNLKLNINIVSKEINSVERKLIILS